MILPMGDGGIMYLPDSNGGGGGGIGCGGCIIVFVAMILFLATLGGEFYLMSGLLDKIFSWEWVSHRESYIWQFPLTCLVELLLNLILPVFVSKWFIELVA